jgi:hypothetical protein
MKIFIIVFILLGGGSCYNDGNFSNSCIIKLQLLQFLSGATPKTSQFTTTTMAIIVIPVL